MNNGMPYGQPYVDPKDHSAEFDGKDIADHKLFAMLPYLLGILGTIVALLVAKDSPYVGFHVREGIRILVSEVLLGLITVVFCWTVVVPIAAAVCFPMKKRRRFCMLCKNLLLFFVETWDV